MQDVQATIVNTSSFPTYHATAISTWAFVTCALQMKSPLRYVLEATVSLELCPKPTYTPCCGRRLLYPQPCKHLKTTTLCVCSSLAVWWHNDSVFSFLHRQCRGLGSVLYCPPSSLASIVVNRAFLCGDSPSSTSEVTRFFSCKPNLT